MHRPPASHLAPQQWHTAQTQHEARTRARAFGFCAAEHSLQLAEGLPVARLQRQACLQQIARPLRHPEALEALAVLLREASRDAPPDRREGGLR